MKESLRRELLGIVLTLLAVFLAATLALQRVPDEGCWTSGGFSGGIGSCVKWGIVSLVGPAAAWLLPLGAIVHGLRLFGRMQSETDRSWMIFFAGAAVLLPIGIALAAPGDTRDSAPLAGIWGSFVAFYLSKWFGSGGAGHQTPQGTDMWAVQTTTRLGHDLR